MLNELDTLFFFVFLILNSATLTVYGCTHGGDVVAWHPILLHRRLLMHFLLKYLRVSPLTGLLRFGRPVARVKGPGEYN